MSTLSLVDLPLEHRTMLLEWVGAGIGLDCTILSHGIHRCIGAPLALQESRIFIEEWLGRIGDFSLDPEVPPVPVTGIAHGLSQLGLRWRNSVGP